MTNCVCLCAWVCVRVMTAHIKRGLKIYVQEFYNLIACCWHASPPPASSCARNCCKNVSLQHINSTCNTSREREREIEGDRGRDPLAIPIPISISVPFSIPVPIPMSRVFNLCCTCLLMMSFKCKTRRVEEVEEEGGKTRWESEREGVRATHGVYATYRQLV